MSKHYVSEQELKGIFDSQFCMDLVTESDSFRLFYEWLEIKVAAGIIEPVEFNFYEVSKLDYRPHSSISGIPGYDIFIMVANAVKSLIDHGKEEKADELNRRILHDSKSFGEAILTIMQYVEVG